MEWLPDPHGPLSGRITLARFGNATTACDAISDIASAIYQPLEEELHLVGVRRCGRETHRLRRFRGDESPELAYRIERFGK